MITELTEKKEKEWDDYVNSNGCSYYFKISWRDVVYNSFKHPYKYFIYTDSEGSIKGVLPIFIIRSFLGIKLISIPYCPYGGIISEDNQVKELLLNKVIKLGEKVKAKYIEIKEIKEEYQNFVELNRYYSFRLNLDMSISEIWKNLSKSNKRKLNKSKKLVSNITIDSNIDIFYKLYSKHLKNIGTPVIRYVFFKDLIENDNTSVKVASIWYEGKVAASILLLETKDVVMYDRGAVDYDLRSLNLNYILFWEVIKYYSSSSIRYFDFGRSIEESGTFQFKRSWRPSIINLNYQYYVFRGDLPEYSQAGAKRIFLSKVLKVMPRVECFDNYLRKLFP